MRARIALLCAAAVDVAAGEARPVWKWTFEERVAARLEPRGVRDPAAADETGAEPPAGFPRIRRAAGPPRIVVDGKRNPELFLPGSSVAADEHEHKRLLYVEGGCR